jgi:hypothetical protein
MLTLRPAQTLRLTLQLSDREEGLAVRVVETPVGEPAGADVVLQRIEDLLRMVSQPGAHEDVGRGLFRALLPGDLGELYRAAYTQATVSGQPLTLELRFDPDLVQAVRYPWELLHDGTRFLVQSGTVRLTRTLSYPEPLPVPPASGPLEVLYVAAHPTGQSPLEAGYQALEQGLRTARVSDQLDLAYLLPPTWDALMDWLLAGAPHVIHFEGHSEFTRTGRLVFEDPQRKADPVDASVLADACYDSRLRLIVLTAAGTRDDGETWLSSTAASLVLAGIPAVVAFQRTLPAVAASGFVRAFYAALIAGEDLPTAVEAGRKPLLRTPFWSIPSLYVRTVQVPASDRLPFDRRLDTAGPHAAQANLPLRVGLWIRRLDTPPPTNEVLRRLLGTAPPEPSVLDEGTDPFLLPVDVQKMVSGSVDVHVTALGFEMHTGSPRRATILPDFDPPLIWFSMTPRRLGLVGVTFELRQGDRQIAKIRHVIDVGEDPVEKPVAVVKSHGAGPVSEFSELRELAASRAAAAAESAEKSPSEPASRVEDAILFPIEKSPHVPGTPTAPAQPPTRPAEPARTAESKTGETRRSAPRRWGLLLLVTAIAVLVVIAALALLLGTG